MIFFVFLLMGMKVRMGIFDHLREEIIANAFDLQFGVFMGMRMLDADGVGDQKPGGGSHQDQSHPKSWQRKRPENQEGENHPQKRSYGVIGARFCGAKLHLRFDVIIDAQPVSYEAKQHG